MAYDGPPDYRNVGEHGMFPKTTHDEKARFNFLAHLNRHLASKILPGVKTAYDTRIAPNAPKPETRHDVRKQLVNDPLFQHWSALRRGTMELRQQAGRWVTIRQGEEMNARAKQLTEGDPRLALDPNLEIPNYLSQIDHHCMPGSYHDEIVPGDVTGAANYDCGIFVTTGGGLGRYNDGGGHAVVAWMKENRPDFSPKRILDIGGGLGQNVLPIAEAYPEAEVVCVDTGAPVLRYGLARAKLMGVENVRFVQANAEDLSMFEDESFDWVQSTMFLHETSVKAMPKIMAESYRLLAQGGIVMHVEQPQYGDDMPLYDQAIRDWDAYYNNEPFWTKMHELDLDQWMIEAGFNRKDLLHGGVAAVVDKDLFPEHAKDEVEDFGRKAAWHIVGGEKKAA
ncbi:methyltransferase domain-containing protein [Litorimonas haliclonae]|uniref:class I SAM-dependent methyltransferase n=1 Tax=Litorimonas haliclonae TaxID=2081977 RepID=UPI0039EDE8BD